MAIHDMIETSAEAAENAILPTLHEVHMDPDRAAPDPTDLTSPIAEDGTPKSEARWAYERLILYIKNFEETLESDQQVAMGFAGSEAGVLRIEGLGYFDPDIITFYGTDEDGERTQLVQHVSQLNVLLRSVPLELEQEEPLRIGFHLARDLKEG